MKRRRALAAGGGMLPVLLSGCLGSGDSGDGADSNSSSDAGSPALDGDFGTTAFGDESCPPYESGADRTVFAHGRSVVRVGPARRESGSNDARRGQPSEEIALTFANRSESDVEFNPNS